MDIAHQLDDTTTNTQGSFSTREIAKAVFRKNMMEDLRYKGGFDSGPLYIENTSALHVAGNRTYSPRAKHIALIYYFVLDLVEGGTITIHYVKTQDQLTDIGTTHLNKQRHRELINKIRVFGD